MQHESTTNNLRRLLNSFITRRPNQNTNLINLFGDRKIAPFTTTENLLRQFIVAKTDKQTTKENNANDKVHDKHHDKEPLGRRMQEAKKENKNRNGANIYSIDRSFIELDKDSAIRNGFKDYKDIPTYL